MVEQEFNGRQADDKQWYKTNYLNLLN